MTEKATVTVGGGPTASAGCHPSTLVHAPRHPDTLRPQGRDDAGNRTAPESRQHHAGLGRPSADSGEVGAHAGLLDDRVRALGETERRVLVSFEKADQPQMGR